MLVRRELAMGISNESRGRFRQTQKYQIGVQMNYLQKAFGVFQRREDHDAAVKLSLSILLADARLGDLSCLLANGHEIGGVEGDPGWTMERRDDRVEGEHSYYSRWPRQACFRVYVDPIAYELAYPEVFMSKAQFHRYVMQAIDAFSADSQLERNAIQSIVSQLNCPTLG